MGTSQKKAPDSTSTENGLSPDQTLGLVSLSLMQKLSQKDPSFSWLVDDKSDKANLKNLRDRLELTDAGFSREQAYKLVQKNAMKAWKENSSFLSNIILDKKITNKIPVNKLKKLFNFSYHTKKINIIFNRSLKRK